MASIDYTGLSFDEIRQNLVEYYKQTNEFKDVDFAGSAIGSLIDSLAYCVKYLTTYANFSLSECFLDSASVRSSVTSIAKTLGYFPYQERTRSYRDAPLDNMVNRLFRHIWCKSTKKF